MSAGGAEGVDIPVAAPMAAISWDMADTVTALPPAGTGEGWMMVLPKTLM